MRQDQTGRQASVARVRGRIHLALLAWLTILLIAASLPGRHSQEPRVKLTSATRPSRR